MAKNILFRADASSTIGTGHIMRDLVLAEQFKDANIIFATQNLAGNINHKIEEKQYSIEILSSNDFQELDTLIKKSAVDMIVIDYYEIDYSFEKQLKIHNPKLKILSFDDTYERHYCDILLNHNVSADSKRYKDLVPKHCELRCGSTYTLLRDEFIIEKQKGRQNSNDFDNLNVFIAMGGADHTNLNSKILEVLERFPNIYAHVVTTTANQHLKALEENALNRLNVTLHINTNHIARLMNRADFAIVTPSVTVNEIIYMNIPFIAIKTAKNQDDIYQYLKKHHHEVVEKFDKHELLKKIEKTIFQETELINFIELSLDEKKMILAWRNHPSIRRWMFTQEEISLDNHLKYIDSLSIRDDKSYFLIKSASIPIGIIDFTNIDHSNKTTKFGLYANPTLKGVGNQLMESLIDYAFNVLNFKKLIAEVFEKNYRAINLYTRYNFKELRSRQVNNKDVIYMELDNENR